MTVVGSKRPRGYRPACDELLRSRAAAIGSSAARFARRVAARYRKRGLDRTARRDGRVPRAARDRAARPSSRSAAASARSRSSCSSAAPRARVNLELSPAYERRGAAAARARPGLEDRVERRLHDIAVDPDGGRAGRRRRAAPRRLLLPRLRAPARRGRRPRAPAARLQPPAAQRGLARVRRRAEPRASGSAAASSARSRTRRPRCSRCSPSTASGSTSRTRDLPGK